MGLLDRPPGMAAAGPWWVSYTIIGDGSTSAMLSVAFGDAEDSGRLVLDTQRPAPGPAHRGPA